jgi:hypothetical protein
VHCAQALDPNSPAASNFNWRGKPSTLCPIARPPGNCGPRDQKKTRTKFQSDGDSEPSEPQIYEKCDDEKRCTFDHVRFRGGAASWNCLFEGREVGFPSIRT